MERVVSLLNDIEDNANTILARANEQKTALYQKLDDDKQKLDKQLALSSNKTINNLKEKYDNELEQEKDVLQKNCNAKIKSMEDNFNNNHDKIIDQIFNKIVNV